MLLVEEGQQKKNKSSSVRIFKSTLATNTYAFS